MHIPDGVLSPSVVAVTGAIGAVGFGYALKRLGGQLRERTTVLMGMMSAFVFAAQMVNFPIWAGVSGHLLGGVLAAVLLGPWAGAVVIGSVLIVQCLLFADGGVLALGANFVNMGLVGSVLGYAIYAPIRRAFGGTSGILIGAVLAAWFSVILSSGVFSVQLAFSGRSEGFLDILTAMTLVHAAIGLGEAIITGLVLQTVLLVRPDLIHDPERERKATADLGAEPGAGRRGRWAQVGLAGLAVSLAVACFLAPFASESPDGLEYVGERFGFLPSEEGGAIEPEAAVPRPDLQLPDGFWIDAMTADLAPVVMGPVSVRDEDSTTYIVTQPREAGPTNDEAEEAEAAGFAPMPDYKIPGLPELKALTALVGTIGTLAVFGLGYGLARAFARRSARLVPAAAGGIDPDAA